MSDPTPQNTQLRFALAVLAVVAVLCIAAGTFLLWKGYQSGELFVGIVGSIAGAIAGMLSMRAPSHPQTPSGAVAAEIINPPEKPVNVTEPKEP